MSESKLFMSSCSRRELAARRRSARSLRVAQALVVIAVVAVCLGAFAVGHGGI